MRVADIVDNRSLLADNHHAKLPNPTTRLRMGELACTPEVGHLTASLADTYCSRHHCIFTATTTVYFPVT
jgi:hypothetical protein